MALANTTWNLTDSSGVPAVVTFGASVSSGSQGGYGTIAWNYGGHTGTITNDIAWMEDGHGSFIFQMKGSPDTGSDQIPTYSGTYKILGATGNGTGIGCNFNAPAPQPWGIWDITISKT